MWSDRNKDLVQGKSTSGNSEPDTGGAIGRVSNVAVIGRGMIIRGDITSRESLHIDGEVEGSLHLGDCRLSIGREAKVGANATAREIELLGIVRGNLEASSRITIRKGARLIGDLRAPGIVIEEGAYVKGKIEIVNEGEPPNVTVPQPARTASAKA